MKKLFPLLMMASALCACSDNEDPNSDPAKNPAQTIILTRAENSANVEAKDFAYDFNRQVNIQAQGKNYFVSPLSAEMALAMLCNGTAGETEQEIRKVLGFEDFTLDDLNSFNQKMLQSLPSLDGRTKVTFANGFWASTSLQLQPSYKELITSRYDASCFSFDNLVRAKQEINSWCDKHTDHMIKEIMCDNDTFDFALFNALYFKGEWTRMFDSVDTRNKDFHNLDGTTSEVPMMHKSDETNYFLYGYNDYCHALFMPFGNRGYYFTVLLPADGFTLDDCAARLNDLEIAHLSKQYHGKCRLVELPRFSLDYACSLNEILQAMGITKLFIPEELDLSGMLATEKQMCLNVKQKARIEVDEKGAKAAAVTSVSNENMAPPTNPDFWEFVVDQPFLFLIREQSTGSVLFSGRINQL